MIFPGEGLTAARAVLGGYVMTDGSVLQAPADVQAAAATGLAVDWSATNYIDWGTFISAIINFLLVALVLFLIIKAINRVREAGEAAKAKIEGEKAEEAEEETTAE